MDFERLAFVFVAFIIIIDLMLSAVIIYSPEVKATITLDNAQLNLFMIDQSDFDALNPKSYDAECSNEFLTSVPFVGTFAKYVCIASVYFQFILNMLFSVFGAWITIIAWIFESIGMPAFGYVLIAPIGFIEAYGIYRMILLLVSAFTGGGV